MTPPDDWSRRRPPLLTPGDLVAAVAPAGPPSHDGVTGGVALLESWGLRVRLMPAALAGHPSGFLAADDDRRLADLEAAFGDDEVAAVFCLRGGYGSQRLLDRLDVAPLVERPKAFVGFSDLTALHVALGQRAGLMTFHGPNLAGDPRRIGQAGAASLHRAVSGGEPEVITGEPLRPGRVRAPVVGGNLTLLSTLCGTPDELDAAGAILLLEDVGEAPYRLDRALTHLRRAGMLDGVAGLAFGTFVDCGGRPGEAVPLDVAAAHARQLDVPAVANLPLGHGPEQRTVLLGAPTELDATAGSLVQDWT